MNPPPCVQNAMMTKDKKPFTYTPGGIDLSEARSPRLQRRIERNANLGGVGDIPQQHPPQPQFTGPLPPSTLAAMRPQPQVQVFPAGPPPPAPMRGGIPPPPPPPAQGVPPPPPPPTCPLPTQKICTGDNQILERPDMTKIIPENPMALLRKTAGPQPRRSLVDQMFEEAGKGIPEPKSPPYQQPQKQFQPTQPQRQQATMEEKGAPISPVPQQNYRPQQYQSQQQPRQEPCYPEPAREQPRYQVPVVNKQASVSHNNNVQPEVKTSTAHLGQLYIPPANQQPQQHQKRIVSPPTPPERNQDTPNIQTPPLREAPRPWQTKKPQEEVPAWAKRDNQVSNNVEEVRKSSPPAAQQQQRWPQDHSVYNPPQPQYQHKQQQPQYQPQPQYQQQPQYRQDQNPQQQPIGVRIEIRTKPQQYQNEPEDKKPNAVYVTQPMVLQHPGVPEPQGKQGGPRTPGGNDRNFNRQQSWGSNNPSQSNSFKVIQKITNTDGEEDYNSPVTEHSPRFPQNFQQPTDQMRKMKINDEHNITNTFKQVPRTPQSAPQKGLQVRTIPIQIEVPCNPPSIQGPVVRNIPIQLEGDDPPQHYVHPSEQVVQEPKKYTGSSIPSRSFKILQAMTAPDNCATVYDQNEAISYDEWAYPPPYPPYPYPPYWYDYYQYYYHPDSYPDDTSNKNMPRSGVSRSTSPAVSGRQTPVPFWGYPYPYYQSNKKSDGRETPKPWLSGYESSSTEKDSTDTDDNSLYHDYLPYYHPYYYHYYYGYPPMYPGYPYYPSDTDISTNGYSTTEEKDNKSKKTPEIKAKNTETPDLVQKPKLTPTINVKEIKISTPKEDKIETSECETDTETDDEFSNHLQINPLQSMKSITNMNVYSSDEERSQNSDEEGSDEIDDVSSIEQDPHQLSIIMEESERTESRLRSASVLSDSTTLAEKSESESEAENEELPADIKIVNLIAEKETVITSNVDNTVDNNEDDDKKSDESEDWWGIIGKEEDDFPRKKLQQVWQTEIVDDAADEDDDGDTTEGTQDGDLIENSSDKQDNIEESSVEPTEKSNSESHNHKEENIIETEPPQYTVVLRRKKPVTTEDTEAKLRPRSIYDSLEDIKTESTGNLVKVDNFVGLLEQIQKDFGSFLNSQPRNDIQFNRPVSMYEVTSCNDNTDDTKEKRFSYGAFEDYAIQECNNSEESSTNYTKYNSSKSSIPINTSNGSESEESSEDTDTSGSEKDEKETYVHLSDGNQVKVPSIKERIQALRNSINSKKQQLMEPEVKEKHNRSKPTSSKSSLKSCEESEEEEEEVDSGVTSDMSRHISDTEEFPELKKMTKYQRAATHSRLFKLLQEQCNIEEDNDEENDQSIQRHTLSLPLNESSYIKGNVNEKLVNELIDSLLRLKKGQIFKNLPKEKLHAAAVKILQEDMELMEASSEEYSSFMSPLKSSTGCSTTVQTPQEFLDEYKQYYETWNTNEENSEIFSSKAFKVLQGSLGKCPKVLSSKSIHKKLIKLLETSDCPLVPQKPPLETNEVTSAS